MASFQAIINRHMARPGRRAFDALRRLDGVSETKGIGLAYFRHGYHTYASCSSRNTLLNVKAVGPVRSATRVHTHPYKEIRSFSSMHTPSLLGRVGTSSLASSSGSSFPRIRHRQLNRHPYPQMPPMASSIGSIASFSSQNNNLTPRPPPNNRSLGNIAGMLGTGGLVLFGKTKYVLAALKLTKLAPLGSMIFTVGTYSMFFGLPYAAGMVGLILVHEIGHAAVMHSRGVPFSPMVFIPFMGAVIATKELPRDAWEDALIAFGGPVLGSLGAGAIGLAGHATDSQLLIALADFGLMINLFNLLPLGSMDGGRIAGALSPYMSVAGVGMGAGLAYTGVIQNPIFYLILLSGGYQTFQRFYNPGAMPPNYYAITGTQRATLGLGYIGLISGLALAMDMNGRYKKSPEVLKREMELEKTWDMR